MIRRDTLEAVAFGIVLLAAISGTAIGFNVLAGGGGPQAGAESEMGDGEHGGDHGGMDHGGGGMSGGMDHGSMEMRMVENGTVINGNTEELPPGCEEVAGERSVTIRGGVAYSEGGEMFSFSRERLEVDPCTRVTITFVNEDEIRHQWMIHGLPMGTYPMGMFNIEVNGPGSATGTFVAPGQDVTLNTHCSLPQHEQKGMHMKVVVGDGGDGSGHGGDH